MPGAIPCAGDVRWGGWADLSNGWRLEMPEMAADTRLPITVDARRLSAAE